jgi:hypothetical protein
VLLPISPPIVIGAVACHARPSCSALLDKHIAIDIFTFKKCIVFMANIFSEFILKGTLSGVGLGDNIDVLKVYTITPSAILNINGEPELYLVEIDGYKANVGVDSEQRISYIVLHFKDQQRVPLNVAIGGNYINLQSVTIQELTAWLNRQDLDWSFCHYWQKVVKLKLEQSQVEFSFDYNLYEDVDSGLVSVQVSIPNLVADRS